MKKIVANMTMGNDMSPLFPDILNVMQVPVLEIKKMVYLYIINYARTKPDMAVMAISMFIKVRANVRLGEDVCVFTITAGCRGPQSTYSCSCYPYNGLYSSGEDCRCLGRPIATQFEG